MDLINKIPSLDRSRSLPQAPTPQLPEAKGIPSSWKLLTFDVLAVILAGAVGYGCLLFFSGSANFPLFVGAAALFLMISFFDFLLTADPRRRALLAGLQILAFLSFFYAVKLPVLLSALAILAVFYAQAHFAAKAIASNSIKFKLSLVARAYIKKVFVGCAVAAIVLYLPQWNSGNIFVPQPQFQRWYNGFAAMSAKFHTGLDFTASVGTFAESLVKTQLATNGQFQDLGPKEQKQAIDSGSKEIVSNLSKNLGFQVSSDMPLAEAFYRYLMNMFANLKKQFGDSFLAAWAVALFVIVWSTGTLGIWLLVILTYIVFEAFAAFNVLHIAGESCTREIVEIS